MVIIFIIFLVDNKDKFKKTLFFLIRENKKV